jgi:stearoyl-CoA desaturase (delta-9 desaturase)
MTGSSIAWTSIHRKHHTHTDVLGDPHSPLLSGYLRAQFLSMFSSVQLAKNPLLKSKFHIFMHKNYIAINVVYSILLYWAGGLLFVVALHLAPAAVTWMLGSFINTICHTPQLGTQPLIATNSSVNNAILGVIMWGEGWHNNHHKYPGRPNIGIEPFQLDIGYLIIKLIQVESP